MHILDGRRRDLGIAPCRRQRVVPATVWAVVARMLAKDPAQRYQRPVDVAHGLAPFIKPGGKAARLGSKLLASVATCASRGCSRFPWVYLCRR